jgi:hypothetical protein
MADAVGSASTCAAAMRAAARHRRQRHCPPAAASLHHHVLGLPRVAPRRRQTPACHSPRRRCRPRPCGRPAPPGPAGAGAWRASSATASKVSTGSTGTSAPKASPWATEQAVRSPVNEPGPAPKAMASSPERPCRPRPAGQACGNQRGRRLCATGPLCATAAGIHRTHPPRRPTAPRCWCRRRAAS